MDICLHEVAERGIDRAMASQRGESVERRADDADAEMPAPIAGSGMADMAVAVIGNRQFGRLQILFESRPDRLNPVDHGRTLRMGLVSTAR